MNLDCHEAMQLLKTSIYKHVMKFNDQLSFDFRLLLTQTRLAQIAGQLLWAQIKSFDPQVLVAPGYGAMSLAYAITNLAGYRAQQRPTSGPH